MERFAFLEEDWNITKEIPLCFYHLLLNAGYFLLDMLED